MFLSNNVHLGRIKSKLEDDVTGGKTHTEEDAKRSHTVKGVGRRDELQRGRLVSGSLMAPYCRRRRRPRAGT